MEESYINKEGLEALIKAGTKQKVTDVIGLVLDGFVEILDTGVSPRVAKKLYMSLLEDFFE